jgi:CheY-like chemotaxis protein
MAKKILLVEDEEIMIDLLQKKLTKEGYEVSIARDGEEGLKLMRSEKPDLVLLDIIMPKMGGFEVMEEMAKDKELKKIPVIVISNSGQPVELDRAQKLGAKDWLIKTEFDPQEVIEKVKRILPTPEEFIKKI